MAQEPAMPGMVMAGETESVFPLGISPTRESSGTSWVPDATTHAGVTLLHGVWKVALHGNAIVLYDRQTGLRSAEQVASLNWAMLEAGRTLGGGLVRLVAMVSAEPLTVPEPGYPQLVQTALVYRGESVSDHEHPEAPVMEAALLYERALGSHLAASLYLAPVGEPALGPPSYHHRPAADFDPIAPLGHSAQDFTHVSYGAATIGLFTRHVKIEGSAFNSAHPDPGAGFAYHPSLNSFSGRASWNPNPTWSVSVSGGHLAAAGGAHVHDATTRLGVSVLGAGRVRRGVGRWASAVIWGADVPVTTDRAIHTLLVESNVVFRRDALFGRVEYVQRTAADLALIGSVPSVSDLGAVSLGYGRRMVSIGSFETWAQAGTTVNLLPPELERFYGSRHPLGIFVGVSERPGRTSGPSMNEEVKRTERRSSDVVFE